MTAPTPQYVIDSCSITAMRRIYPKDVFPGAWSKLSELAETGTLISSEQVLEELKVQDDMVLLWAKAHHGIFLPLYENIQVEASKILQAFPDNLLDLKKRRSGADPFLIATAKVNSCTVVTEENPSGGPPKVKIPDVCRAMRIECIAVLEMLRREGLKL